MIMKIHAFWFLVFINDLSVNVELVVYKLAKLFYIRFFVGIEINWGCILEKTRVLQGPDFPATWKSHSFEETSDDSRTLHYSKEA